MFYVKIGTMKKYLVLILTSLVLFQACSLFGGKKIENLAIVLAPVEVPEDLLNSSEAFKTALKASLLDKGYNLLNIDITVGSSNLSTQEALINQEADVAFLPILNYLDSRDDGIQLLASTTHSRLNLGTDDLSIYNQKTDLSTVTELMPYRRSLIYTGPSEYGKELYSKSSTGQEITWIDLNQAAWCHVVVTSLDGYVYPSLWLIDHYERRMGELFDHTLVVKGYFDMMAALADESCDVAVGPDTLRNTYENTWVSSEETGYGRSLNIYDEVNVIGVTDKIYDDVFAMRVAQDTDTEFMDEAFIKALQESLIDLSQDETQTLELFKLLGFEGLTIADPLEYETGIPALEYIQRIMN